MIIDPECVHWWIIDSHGLGHCKKCGDTRDFEKLREQEKTLAANRKTRNKADINVPRLNPGQVS